MSGIVSVHPALKTCMWLYGYLCRVFFSHCALPPRSLRHLVMAQAADSPNILPLMAQSWHGVRLGRLILFTHLTSVPAAPSRGRRKPKAVDLEVGVTAFNATAVPARPCLKV